MKAVSLDELRFGLDLRQGRISASLDKVLPLSEARQAHESPATIVERARQSLARDTKSWIPACPGMSGIRCSLLVVESAL